MSDLYRVTYMGEGVRSTAVGAFAKHVTAYVEEDFARSLAGQEGWVIADPSGKELGGAPPKAEKTEKKPAPAPAPEEKPEPRAEAKPEAKPEAKAEAKPTAKPAPAPEADKKK